MMNFTRTELKEPCRIKSNLVGSFSIKKKHEKDYKELRIWLNDNNQSLGDYICESYIELIKPCFSN